MSILISLIKDLFAGKPTDKPGPAENSGVSSHKQDALKDTGAASKNRGDKYFDEGNFKDAALCYREAITANPGFAEAFDNLGISLWQQKQYEEAEQCLKQALLIAPGMVYTYYNLASMLFEQGKLQESLQYFSKAIDLKPDFAEAHNYMGVLFKDLGNLTESISSFRRALEYDPGYYTAKAQMVHQLQQLCQWDGLEADTQSLRQAVAETQLTDKNLLHPFAFLSLPGTTSREQRNCAERFVHVQYQPLAPLRNRLGFEFRRPPNGKIRLGYLSADFHDHATARLMAEIFELHDRNRFHITAYSYGPDDGSAMRKRLVKAFDQFVDIREITLESAAKQIHSDRIDILVDLKGHTLNSRSGLLALRPAPVQVNYLGYPGTMGTEFADYLIADRFIIPPEQLEDYTEKVIWLPDCYQPTDRTRQRLPAPTRKECGLPENGFIFCCFNQPYKIAPKVFDVWCQLLKSVPESCLWLWVENPLAEGNLKREAANRGISPERLVMAHGMEAAKHLARLQCADLFLDTIPYNAHTTCSDALWVGLPVITCAGDTFPSRVAGSLLTAMGVPELITYNLTDYYRLALELAVDRNKLEAIRRKIIANRDTAPLFDSERFTRNLETAFVQMVDEHSGSTSPAHS